jgi:small subunit ribosomal protein S20
VLRLIAWPTAVAVLCAVPFPGPLARRRAGVPSNEREVANIRSQIKRNRQNERRRLRNKSVRSEMRTRTKRAAAALEAGDERAPELLVAAVRRIDKAAAGGVIHRNQAANRKSKLMRRAQALATGQGGA